MLRRMAIILVMITLMGCGRAAAPTPPMPEPSPAPADPPPATAAPTTPPPAPADHTPELWDSWPEGFTRDELRDGLERLMNAGGDRPAEKLTRLFSSYHAALEGQEPWQQADLDGDGTPEYVVAASVPNGGWRGAGLFVIYQRDGRYHVDLSKPMDDAYEVQLMAPYLHAVADLTGSGTPQIVWSRPMLIVTGPQPLFVFVTTWHPGSFTTLDGDMVISSTPSDRPTVVVDGREIVLTGGSRRSMFLGERTDRYRFVDGAFRLVDRRFTQSGESKGAYERFWDGLVAEDVGRLADAETAYRDALDPSRPLPKQVSRYHNFPLELTQEETAGFGESLRALARLRLGALLAGAGRQQEATELLTPATGPYKALTDALLQAGDRSHGCEAAAAWAGQDARFLPALNRGIADQPWTPPVLCSHPAIDDRILP